MIFFFHPLENFPPKLLVGPTELNITVNTTTNVTIVAQDPNNDTMTFSVSGTLPKGHTTSTTDSSMSLVWKVTTDKVPSLNLPENVLCYDKWLCDLRMSTDRTWDEVVAKRKRR